MQQEERAQPSPSFAMRWLVGLSKIFTFSNHKVDIDSSYPPFGGY